MAKPGVQKTKTSRTAKETNKSSRIKDAGKSVFDKRPNAKRTGDSFDILKKRDLLKSLEHSAHRMGKSQQSEPTRPEIIQSYSQPIHRRRVGGVRWSIYSLLLVLIAGTALILARYKPEVFGIDHHLPAETGALDQINYVYIDRFSFEGMGLPDDGTVVYDETMELLGWIKPGVYLKINEIDVPRDADGFFEHTLQLQEGANTLTFEVGTGTKIKKTSRLIIYQIVKTLDDIVVADDTGDLVPDDQNSNILSLEVNAWPDPIVLQVSIDGGLASEYVLNRGMTKSWEAKSEILINTDNARSTFVVLNHAATGEPMGEKDSPLQKKYRLDDLI